MRDLMARVREWFGVPHTPDMERELMERRVRDQQQRLARVDAGLPADRRHRVAPQHPRRRVTDS